MSSRNDSSGARRRRGLTLAATVCSAAALAATASGCGGSDSGSGDGASAAGSASPTAAASSPAKLNTGSGSELLCVTSLISFGLAPQFLEGYKQIAKDLNMKYVQKIAAPDGNLQNAASNIEQCVRSKATAIVGIATDNSAVAPQIASAAKAGIPYIADQSGSPVPGVRVTLWGNEWQNSSKLIGYLITNYTKPRNVYVLKATALPVVRRRTTGFLAAAAVEKGQINVVGSTELDVTAIANSATDKVTAAVRGNKDINVIVAPFDDPAAGALAALKRLGREDIDIVSYDGLEPTYSAMRNGEKRYAAVAALPGQAFFDLRKTTVSQILGNKLAPSVNALCTGPLITAANVPAKGDRTQGGECIVNGKVETAESLGQQAAGAAR